MLQRWLVAIIGLPLLLAILLFCPPWATMLLVCTIAGISAYELLRVAGKNVNKVVYAFTVAIAVAQVARIYFARAFLDTELCFPYLEESRTADLFLLPLLLTVVLFLIAVITYGKPNAVPFQTVTAGIVGGAVFPMMFACILLLRMKYEYGRLFVLAPFFIAWAGFWGNVLGSALGMLLFGFVGNRWLGYQPNYPYLLLIGVVANLCGQLGDLSMSLIKREHDIKDYSHLFLTHGGVLDRFDSTMFIAPVVYYFTSVLLLN